MDERAAVCWIHRRAGFGLAPAELDAAVATGAAGELDRLFGPEMADSVDATDPWRGVDLPADSRDRTSAILAIDAWLDTMAATTTPLVDRLAWLWHGHFVSALDKVKDARSMVEQMRLFRRAGSGPFADLLTAVAADAAMLRYLDGTDSTGEHPNENFSREVLELFTIGVGEYAEADVHSGAAALTGWRVRRRTGDVAFVPGRHDDTARTYLGADGVHDLTTVVGAIMSHTALATSIASMVAGELLGTTDAAVVAPLASAFAASGHAIGVLVRATLQAGLDGASTPVVLAPVPWLAIAQRVTGARIDARLRRAALRTAGQLPMLPPNVAGWPGGPAWFGSSTIVARAQLAAAVAEATPPDSVVGRAAGGRDLEALAVALGLPTPAFGAASHTALTAASPGTQRLALALCAPEFVIA